MLNGGLGGFRFDNGDKTTLFGPSGVGGGGFDLVRWKRVAVGVEMMTVGMIDFDEGLLTTTSFMLDVSVE